MSKTKNKSKPEKATHYVEEIKFNNIINQLMAEAHSQYNPIHQ